MALSKIDLSNMVENDLAAGSQPLTIIENKINFRNIIINGDMSVAQRSTSTASITSGGYHTVDRFYTGVTTAGTWTQSQSTTVPSGQGFATSLKMDCTTADSSLAAGDLIQLVQYIEGQNVQYLKYGTSSAQSLTLSFWVRSNKTGTYIAELRNTDNTRTRSLSYTISSADTWEKKTITFGGDTNSGPNNDNGEGLRLTFWLAAGSNYSSGTLATDWESTTQANRAVGQVNLADSTSNEWYITGVQLEAGTAASDFEFLPVDVNLQRCLRYFVTFDDSFYPTGSGNQSPIGMGFYNDSTTGIVCVNTKVPMRAYPSVTHSGASDFDSEPFDEAPSAIAIYSQGTSYVPMLTVTTPSQTRGYAYCLVMDTADGYLHLSSEL